VYFGADSVFYALNPSGDLKWRYQAGGLVVFSPAIGSDGTVYFGSCDHCLYALTPSGELKWRYQTGDTVYSYPAVGFDGTVYFGSVDGYLYALTPEGTLKWRYQTGSGVYAPPAVGSDSTVYVGAYDGYFYAIESSSKGLASSPWPEFHHDNYNTGRYSLGISATTIVAPEEGSSVDRMNPTAYFTNTNVEAAKDFYCHCEISSSGFASTGYHDSVFVSDSLAAGDSLKVEFSDWLCHDSLSYTAKFYATGVFSTPQTIDFNGKPVGIVENTQPSLSVEVSELSHGIKVSCTLPEGQSGLLRIYNVTGQRVAQRAVTSSGEVEFNQPLSRGVYVVRLESQGRFATAKVVLK